MVLTSNMLAIDQYTIQNILSYIDNDTKLILNRVNSHYHTRIDTTNIRNAVYKANSLKLFKYKKLNVDHKIFAKICQYCSVDIVNFMEPSGEIYWDNCLYCACKGNNLDVVQLLINKGVVNTWEIGLCGACRGGHTEMAQLMIDKGANDLNNGLNGACKKGHLGLVRFMVSKGADKCDLYYACYGGNMEIIQYVINRGGDDWASYSTLKTI